jgi:hypothetical protein
MIESYPLNSDHGNSNRATFGQYQVQFKFFPEEGIVESFCSLFGKPITMIPWPKGKKGGPQKWSGITYEYMSQPKYCRELTQGNIGIINGAKSSGLIAVDVDSDVFVGEFLALGKPWNSTLISRGNRGVKFWFFVDCVYPGSQVLYSQDGVHAGEWRAEGNQTIIHGIHPEGNRYSINAEGKIETISNFEYLAWTDAILPPVFKHKVSPRYTGSTGATGCSLEEQEGNGNRGKPTARLRNLDHEVSRSVENGMRSSWSRLKRLATENMTT